MEFKPLNKTFKIHVWGYSQETLEVELFIRSSQDTSMAVESIFRNIYDYLTIKLLLSSDHLYIFINVV